MQAHSTKARRTFTAALVAALFFLAGGLLLNSEDTAAEKPTYLSGDLTITSENAQGDYYLTADGAVLRFPAGVHYTGTVSCGYHCTVTGDDVTCASVRFTASDAMEIRAVSGNLGVLDLTIDTVSGGAALSCTILQGAVRIGDSGSVSGTIAAGKAVFTLDDARFMILAVEKGTGILTGYNRPFTGTTTVDGIAECRQMAVGTDGRIIVAENAAVTAAPNIRPQYTFAVGSGVLGDGRISDAELFDSNGYTPYYGSVAVANDGHSLTVSDILIGRYLLQVFCDPMVGGNDNTSAVLLYDLIVVEDEFYVFPTFAITDVGNATAAYCGEEAADRPSYPYYQLSFSTSSIDLTADDISLYRIDSDDGTATVMTESKSDSTGYSCWISCYKGKVTVCLSADDELFPVSGTAERFLAAITGPGYGGVTGQYLAELNVIPSFSGTTDIEWTDGSYSAAAAGLLSGLPDPGEAEAIGDIAALSVMTMVLRNEGTVTVDGSLDLTYVPENSSVGSAAKYPSMILKSGSSLSVSETGRMTYDTSSAAAPASYIDACYYGNPAAYAREPYYSFVYTDLSTAVKEAAAFECDMTVTVLGSQTLTTDLLIPAGTAGTGRYDRDLILAVAAEAQLKIGTEEKATVLTVPNLDDHNGLALAGLIYVENGRLQIDGLTADTGQYPYDRTGACGVYAAAFVNNDDRGVFTDLTAALNLAADGDTVKMRVHSFLRQNTEVKANTVLDLNGHSLLVGRVDEKGTVTRTADLTVNGTIDGWGSADEGLDASSVYIVKGSAVTLNTDEGRGDRFCWCLGVDLRTALYLENRIGLTDEPAGGDPDLTEYRTDIWALNGGSLTVNSQLTAAPVYAISGTLDIQGTVTAEMYWGHLPERGYSETDGICDDLEVNVKGTIDLGSCQLNAAEGTGSPALNITVDGILNLTEGRYTYAGEEALYNCSTQLNLTINAGGSLNATEDYRIVNGTGSPASIVVAGTAAAANGSSFRILSLATADDTGDLAVTVSGTLAVDALYSLNDGFLPTAPTEVTVNGGKLTVAGTYLVGKTAVSGSGTLHLEEIEQYARTDGLTLTEAGKVSYENGQLLTVWSEMTAGTAPAVLAETINDTSAHVVLHAEARALVYGTAAGIGFVDEKEMSRTALHTVADDTFLFAAEYANSETAALSLPQLSFSGWRFSGWYETAHGQNTVKPYAGIGYYSDVYALFTPCIHTVTFTYVPGAVYLVNEGLLGSGPHTYDHGTELTVKVLAGEGYAAGNATLYVNDETGKAELTFTVIADTTITADGLSLLEKDISPGLTAAEILLILLVVIAAIIIAVVIKTVKK